MKKQDALVRLEDDKYYILATSSYADDKVCILNYEDSFGVFDRWGDVKQIGSGVQGIYHQGTRFISETELEINHYRPLLLSSNIKNENEILSVDLTNSDMDDGAGMIIPKGSIHIARTKFLQNGSSHELIILTNYGTDTYKLELVLSFYADFKDIFEVRGMERKEIGKIFSPTVETNNIIKLSYEGLDNIRRETHIQFDPEPYELLSQSAIYKMNLEPKQSYSIHCTAVFQVHSSPLAFEPYINAFNKLTSALEKSKQIIPEIYTDNEQFNNWVNRSANDLRSLLVQTQQGLYPYAGVPWYNTAFGRDGVITAFETLWIVPDIAKGVLNFLAHRQAKKNNAFQDAELGKILHEMRSGEMAETGEIPFKSYYGSIDSTPLFILLAGHYLRRTNDLDTVKNIWENILQALHWIDNYGDIDGDGFVEYQRKTESGLTNQGWKDSSDSISYDNGELATFPIALCEVQAYVYDAKIQAAYIAERLGDARLAEKLKKEAEQLKKHFNDVFWDEELGTYVLALDGEKRPCRVLSSNAGHTLFSGIATEERAIKTVKVLMNEEMFTGWGVRTLSSKASRYNPMSYHNGSVWPHDTALIAYGFARYGQIPQALRLMQGLFDASLFIELQRLPELFCGFPFRKGEAPTAYPVACSPQAWSVAAVFLLFQACLQITIDGCEKKFIFHNPALPDYINEIRISNLRFEGEEFSIEIVKYDRDLGIHLIKKPAGWQVVTLK
ncbi:MAG TPA: amylo-alpha-1,6-glucosidase [Chitinophagaceae bacterium]|nr:amylo-alpha-1,6-glucosidase [Chitinophagaceae bacterium]